MTPGAQTLAVEWLVARPGLDPPERGRSIAIRDGRIAGIGPGSGPGLLALPAPANAHDHGRGLRTAAFGAPDAALEVWLPALALEPKVDPYLRAAVAFCRMARGGAAAANHCHNTQDPDRLVEEAVAVSRAARDVGLRIGFAVPVMDRNPIVYADPAPLAAALGPAAWQAWAAGIAKRPPVAEQLARIEAIAAFEHPLFAVQYGPVAPQWCSDEMLAAIAGRSATSGRRIHMHLLETRYQREWADGRHPDGLVRHLDGLGLLSPRLTIAHGVWLDDADCALLSERGVTVSVNTSSNLRLRSGLAPVERFREAGLPFAFGLDGLALDDDEDLLRELRLTALLHQGPGLAGRMRPDIVFDAACRVGPRSITGAEDHGTIAPGRPADLLVLDYAALAADALDPADDPLALVLTRMTRQHIAQLVVAGRTVVRDRRVVTVDEAALTAELLAQARAAGPPGAAALERLDQHRRALAGYYAAGHHRPGADGPA